VFFRTYLAEISCSASKTAAFEACFVKSKTGGVVSARTTSADIDFLAIFAHKAFITFALVFKACQGGAHTAFITVMGITGVD